MQLGKNLYTHLADFGLADFGLAEYKKDLKGVSVEKWKSTGKPTGFELISVTPYCTNFSLN